MNPPRGWTASLYVPLITALIGMSLVLSSVFFFLFAQDDQRRLVAVMMGLVLMLAATWFAANPFFRNRRRYLPLRREVENLTTLVPELHEAGLAPRDEERIKQLTDQMYEMVDQMAGKAGQSGEEPTRHSFLSASTGSTRLARRAGINAARAATEPRSKGTPSSVTGSQGPTP